MLNMKGPTQGSERLSMHAAEELFRKYYAGLCHYAFQFTSNSESARDIAQETFVVYLAEQEQISTHPAAIKSFLYTTVRNACLNTLRHEKVVDKFMQQQPAQPVDETGAIHAIIKSEVLAAVHRAIKSLPVECQRIIRMGYIDGLKNQQIADMLDVSINTVKTQKKRGLQLLRLRLPPEMYMVLVSMLTCI
jgi:RNA polymerase sigma-70 factor (ECF subfamily)